MHLSKRVLRCSVPPCRTVSSVTSVTSARATIWLLVLVLATGQPIGLAASDYFGQVTFNGLVVPGVTVTAIHADKKAAATTDADGIYHLTDLADGIWTLTIEMLGFETITREITVPAENEPPPDTLAVRSFDELAREIASRPAPSEVEGPERPVALVRDQPAADLSVLIGPTGMGAADGLLINGSVNNGASTPFANPRAFGNNRPGDPLSVPTRPDCSLETRRWMGVRCRSPVAAVAKPEYTDASRSATSGAIRLPGPEERRST